VSLKIGELGGLLELGLDQTVELSEQVSISLSEVAIGRGRWMDLGIVQQGASIVEPRDEPSPSVLE
jgi:hypothetical protein